MKVRCPAKGKKTRKRRRVGEYSAKESIREARRDELLMDNYLYVEFGIRRSIQGG